MLLNLSKVEADVLASELDAVTGRPEIDSVKAKLTRTLRPVPTVLPGQTTIDDMLGGDAHGPDSEARAA